MKCPGCAHQAGSVALVSDVEVKPAEPEAGDVIVCPNCLAILAVDAGGKLRVMQASELVLLSNGVLREINKLQGELLAEREAAAPAVPWLPVVLN